jgi:hypothetical protein
MLQTKTRLERREQLQIFDYVVQIKQQQMASAAKYNNFIKVEMFDAWHL